MARFGLGFDKLGGLALDFVLRRLWAAYSAYSSSAITAIVQRTHKRSGKSKRRAIEWMNWFFFVWLRIRRPCLPSTRPRSPSHAILCFPPTKTWPPKGPRMCVSCPTTYWCSLLCCLARACSKSFRPKHKQGETSPALISQKLGNALPPPRPSLAVSTLSPPI